MKATGIAFPEAVVPEIAAAYPEYDWFFVSAGQMRGLIDMWRPAADGRDPDRAEQVFVVWQGGEDAVPDWVNGLARIGTVNLLRFGPEGLAERVSSYVMLPLDGSAETTSRKDDRWLVPPAAMPAPGTPFGRVEIIGSTPNLHARLRKLPKGGLCNLSSVPLKFGERLRLIRSGHPLVEAENGILPALLQSDVVIADNFHHAALARMLGKKTLYVESRSTPGAALTGLLSGEPRQLERLYADLLRHVDTERHVRVDADTVRAAFWTALGDPGAGAACTQDAAYIMVGEPAGVCASPARLFSRYGVVQAPREFNADIAANNPETFGDFGLILWHAYPNPAWVTATAGPTRLMSRYPCGIPMQLGSDRCYFPVLIHERIAAETPRPGAGRGLAVRYDLAADIDALTDAERTALAADGRRLLPGLGRLQASWRQQRHDIFTMARRFPLYRDVRRLVVLGSAARTGGMPVETNPDGLDDLALVRHLLAQHPESEIIFQPSGTAADDTALLKEIGGLGPQVKIIEFGLDPSELAPVVEGFVTLDSPRGVAAILTGRPVTVYGTPSYAGLGLTRDLDLEGTARPRLVARPLDLETFAGWYFTRVALFVDPLSGAAMSPEQFIADWLPPRDGLSDTIAGRLVDHVLDGGGIEPQIALIPVLQGYVRNEALARLLDGIDMAACLSEHPAEALAAAEARAWLGDWRAGLKLVCDVVDRHHAKHMKQATDTIVRIRAQMQDKADIALFGHFLLSMFRKTPAKEIELIGKALEKARYFTSAAILYHSLPADDSTLASICRCLIGRSRIDEAHEVLAELVARGAPARAVESLELALAEARTDWPRAIALRAADLDRNPGDLNAIEAYADACQKGGEYGKASRALLRLVRTVKGGWAIRQLAEIELAQMNAATACGILEPYLQDTPTDRAARRLMGDCLAYENRREEACEEYYGVLLHDPLDVTTYTKLRALEDELQGMGWQKDDTAWSARFRARLAQVEDPTVETLLAEGRAYLLDNDLSVLRRNAQRAMRMFPRDIRSYAWYAHAAAWAPGARDPGEIAEIKACYNAALAAGSEDGWWTAYDFTRALAHLGEIDDIRTLLDEQHDTLFVGQKSRTGWPRFVAGAALSDVGVAFEGLRDYPRSAMIRRHARAFRLASSLDEIRPGEKVLFLSEGGVGDEIRYATSYPELAERFPDAAFSVDRRLLPLFRRSFPDVARFLPLPRYHRGRIHQGLHPSIRDLPDQALAPFFDNSVWRAANAADVVIPVPSVMADLRPDIASFEAGPPSRLVPDPALVGQWRDRLQPWSDRLLVGVIATSMILEYQRVANYFTPDDMREMFDLPDVQFVNLNYADSTEEIAHIRDRFGVTVLDFDDLDKMDDFDGVLALATALDCVVGVNTATIELTAFGGVKTIFAAPNKQHSWRDPWGTGRDLFFPDMRVVMSDTPAGKPDVVHRIAGILARERDTKQQHGASRP